MTQQWISVKDRLPDKCGDVIVFNSSGFTHVAYFNFDNFLYKPNKGMGSVIAEGHRSVTHWMPLPAPPGSEPDLGPVSSGTPCSFNIENPDRVEPLNQ